jgi:3-hydroxyisobutyrate dehydrogenase-like beta-hydroxyacid dehydrogenase
MSINGSSIAFIGLGEAASTIISGWGNNRANQIQAFDIKLHSDHTKEEIIARASKLNIQIKFSLKELIRDADLIFSTVTADQALAVAKKVSMHLKKGSFFFDLNSCAPSSKQEACENIQIFDGRYVDVAVMAPVSAKKHLVPLMISGDKAFQACAILEKLPMDVKIIEGPVGRASSIKMVRSIMVKGLEALTAECALAAVEADVLDEVFNSLSAEHPHFDIIKHSIYNFERSLSHGKRRAEELKEVSKMLEDLRLANHMSKATAIWQNNIGSLAKTNSMSEIKENFISFAKQLADELRDIKE